METKFENFSNIKYMYHVTKKSNLDSIKSKGLLINQPYYMTYGGSWATDVYGCNPIFLSKYPTKTEKQDLVMIDDIILKVDITNLPLVVDLPSLIDHGARVSDDEDFVYWRENREPKEIVDCLDENGEVYFDDLLNPDYYAIDKFIKLTGSAAVMINIPPDLISQ
jgi:hypothetical protein